MSEIYTAIQHQADTLCEQKKLNAGEANLYRLYLHSCSPFSAKLRTYMNFKEIPYKRMQVTLESYLVDLPKLLGRGDMPVVLTPDDQVMQDSTPIMQWFEEKYTDHSAIPEDKRLAFFMWLIEEFSDEYLTRFAMHYRWGNDMNRVALSKRIARTFNYGKSPGNLKGIADFVVSRQSNFDAVLGLSGQAERANVEQQLKDMLTILDAHFETYQFLLGDRPSFADFGVYGTLWAHLFNDPYSACIMEELAPQTCGWLEKMSELGDKRGQAGQTIFGDWVNLDDAVPETLSKLLEFIGKTYIPLAKATAAASAKKEKQMKAVVYDLDTSFGTSQYRAWSFEQLQTKFQELPNEDKTFVDKVLEKANVQPSMMEASIVLSTLFDGFTPPFVKDGFVDARVKHMRSKNKEPKPF